MNYTVQLTDKASDGLRKLALNEPKAYQKALKLIGELYSTPKTGIGHPEPLKGLPQDRWSRQITKKHRLVYQIREAEVIVLVLTAYGHSLVVNL